MASKTYAPLPFSYLTGGSAPENSPTYGVKTSVSNDDSLQRPNNRGTGPDSDPYSIFAGKPNAVRKDSIDVTDPKLDVTDPYLLSTGRTHKDKSSSSQDIVEDPRYRDSVPSESDGNNVFFRPPEGGDAFRAPSPRANPDPRTREQPDFYPAPSLQRTAAYTNPSLDNITRDEDTASNTGKKLPRYKVDSDTGYQFYSGNNGLQGRSASPAPNKTSKGMESASNPVWDKYYAGGPPAAVPAGYGAYPPTPTPTPVSAGIRPTTKEDDFNTLLRNSSSSDSYNKGCCKTKACAVTTAVILTAIICLGAGFAGGWFIYQIVNPVVGDQPATTLSPPSSTAVMTSRPGTPVQTTGTPTVATNPTTTTTTTTTTTPAPPVPSSSTISPTAEAPDETTAQTATAASP